MVLINGMVLFYLWISAFSAVSIFLLGGFKESFWLGVSSVAAFMYLEHLA